LVMRTMRLRAGSGRLNRAGISVEARGYISKVERGNRSERDLVVSERMI
jgi:hypothetical protein